MDTLDKAFSGEWVSLGDIKAFGENYQKEFGRIKRAIVGNISGGIAGGVAGGVAGGPPGVLVGSPAGAILGTVYGVGTRKYQVIFADGDGDVDSEIVVAVNGNHACRKVKGKFLGGSKFQAFKFPEEMSSVDRYVRTLEKLKRSRDGR
jgi:hypothetical protein